MKKTLLSCCIAFYSTLALAQTVVEQPAVSESVKDRAFEEEMFSLLNMKVFHDREVVQKAITQLSTQQEELANERLNLTEGILEEKDSNTLENAMVNKQIKYKISSELLEKAEEAPFEAFKDLVKNASVPKITKEEMAELGQVDRKAIPEIMLMANESGPDLGAGRVSVIYDNEN